jgi:hypothetical protein
MINRSCANIILVLLFPFYWVLEGNAQGVWARTYGDLEPQMAYSVIETSDHYYLFAGATDYESWLVKTDILGDTLWTKTFGGKDAYSVIETSDQSYLLRMSKKGPYEVVLLHCIHFCHSNSFQPVLMSSYMYRLQLPIDGL